jgi:hypothetical protein
VRRYAARLQSGSLTISYYSCDAAATLHRSQTLTKEQYSVTHHHTEFEGGARIVRHGRYLVFQLAEVVVPRALFAEILRRVDQLRPKSTPLEA